MLKSVFTESAQAATPLWQIPAKEKGLSALSHGWSSELQEHVGKRMEGHLVIEHLICCTEGHTDQEVTSKQIRGIVKL